MNKHHKWLLSELDVWLKEGVIDTQQAARLRSRYASPAETIPWATLIFSSIGAIIFGLGLILLFAYNWQLMHKFVKLAIVFSALIIVHALALWYRRPQSRYPAIGEGLHVLGTIFFGAGIWLIAQIYHIDEHFPNAFLIWGIGAAALAWTLPSIAQGVIAAALFVIWHGSEVFEFNTPNHIGSFVVFFGVVLLGWLQRSRVLLFLGIASLYFTISISSFETGEALFVIVLFALACLLLALRQLVMRSGVFPQSSGVFLLLGYAVYFVMLYVLTFAELFEDLDRIRFSGIIDAAYFAVLPVLALAAWIAALIRGPGRNLPAWIESALPFAALVLFSLAVLALNFDVESDLGAVLMWTAIVFFNIALFVHGSLLIIDGSRHGELIRAALGCLLVSVIVVTRYIDLFDSLLMRSMAFFIVGAIIFFAGNLYARNKKRREVGP